ncbi:dihydropteroate synthase [Roseiarcus fermentans]|uniref:Dihydropteroate synthase n=1 Tax=Roseiarcus fermentans TaxID=1473586 RepID=A0A366FIX8_9HYPH|nr:dihydropteroate synthase [Roseiarcus fermentans]RBP14076.1 dihydropteroate synthase [Roseiarcus fermentans]
MAHATKPDRDRRRDAFLGLIGVRPAIMGILNVTPDSFSDGGRFLSLDLALAQAEKLVADGADIVDVGAESTRPGHTPVPLEEEWRRLEPVLGPLLARISAPVSIDTSKAAIARRAIALGVSVVNDVWGLQKDPDMAGVVAEGEAAVVMMHNRAAVDPEIDIVADMLTFFERSLALADRAGIPRARMLIDPGVGFGKTKGQNLQALKATPRLVAAFGLPALIGVSRKRLFGDLLGAGVESRLIGTLAANLATLALGAAVFRVHDVAEHAAAFKVVHAIETA